MANKKISQLNAVTTLSGNDTVPVVQGTETKKAKISDIKNYLPTATGSVAGLLSNTDWNTFNNKQSALTLGNVSEATSSVLTITGGTSSIIGSGLSIQVKQANGSQSGYLSSSDWTTFNNKLNSLTLTTTGTSGSASLVGSTLNIPQYLGSALISLGGQTGDTQTLSTDTTGTDFSITSAANNHKFSIPNASASARGLLTSTDWSTFNAKEPAVTKGNLTESTSSVLTITGGTGSVIGSGTSIQVKQANSTQSGFLSSGDWSTFNGKQGSLSLTTTGSSGAATLVNNVLNIPQYTGGGGGFVDPIKTVYGLLGSTIKGTNICNPVNKMTTGVAMVTTSVYFYAYYLDTTYTITGCKYYVSTAGTYTASNYNGVGLYTYSSGILTLVASCSNDATMWNTGGWRSKAFSSTYSASSGMYFVALVYSASSGTAPSLAGFSNEVAAGIRIFDFTNSAKIAGVATGQTSLPSTINMNVVSTTNLNHGIYLY